MNSFIDKVQSAIIDIRYENMMLKKMEDYIANEEDEYLAEEYLVEDDIEWEVSARDIYGNIIGSENAIFPNNGSWIK